MGNKHCVKNFDKDNPFERALLETAENISAAFKCALAWDHISPIFAQLPHLGSSCVMVQSGVDESYQMSR
jgi:hypothetical protein